MPIYEYECIKCKSKLEFIQKVDDKPIKNCPKCGGELIKLISKSSFLLKGNGWYATDYKNKSKLNGT